MTTTSREEKAVPRAPSTTFPYSLPAPKPLRQFDQSLDLSSLSLTDLDLDGLDALSALNLGRLGEGEEEEGVLNLGVEEGGDESDDDTEIDSMSSSVTEVPRSTFISTPGASAHASSTKVTTAVLPPSPSESSSSSSALIAGASHPHASHASHSSPSLKRSRRRSYPTDESHDLEWDCGIWLVPHNQFLLFELTKDM